MARRILVLGGNGFIGSHLVKALVANGESVRVLTRTGPKGNEPVHGVEYRFVDFADSIGVAESLVDIDIVVHLISTTVPATGNLDPLADIQGNLVTTVRLLQQMRDQNISRLVYLSSGGTVYGNTEVVPIPEEHEKNPLSSYGIVKVAIENYIRVFTSQHGLKSLVLRVSNPYGPRQGHLGVQGVIPTFFQRIISGEEIQIWGTGATVRDYLYVDDLIRLMLMCIQNDLAGVYNVGSGQGVSLNTILSLIEDVSGISACVKYLPSRGFDVNKVVLDITKIRKELDWQPQVSLREGCEKYWKWVTG